MDRVDTNTADLYKHNDRKSMKRVKQANPTLTKAEIYKNYRGDPVISKYHPLKYFGSISEKIDDSLRSYIENESAYVKREKEGQGAPKIKFQPI